jgi:hypothetical protein
MTPFIPGGQSIISGSLNAGLVALNLEPDGIKFDKPVEITLENQLGESVRFGNMQHIVEANGTSNNLNDVVYDNVEKAYKVSITGFSNHMIVVGVNTKVSTGTETLDTKIIDNLGKQLAKTESITVNQKYGWTINGNLNSSIKSKYPTLPTATVDALESSIVSAVSSLIGSFQGIGDLSLSVPFNVSGDTKLTVDILAQVATYTFSFPLIFADGGLQWFDVSVKKYVGSELKTTYQYGNSYTDHSGGSGS